MIIFPFLCWLDSSLTLSLVYFSFSLVFVSFLTEFLYSSQHLFLGDFFLPGARVGACSSGLLHSKDSVWTFSSGGVSLLENPFGILPGQCMPGFRVVSAKERRHLKV